MNKQYSITSDSHGHSLLNIYCRVCQRISCWHSRQICHALQPCDKNQSITIKYTCLKCTRIVHAEISALDLNSMRERSTLGIPKILMKV